MVRERKPRREAQRASSEPLPKPPITKGKRRLPKGTDLELFMTTDQHLRSNVNVIAQKWHVTPSELIKTFGTNIATRRFLRSIRDLCSPPHNLSLDAVVTKLQDKRTERISSTKKGLSKDKTFTDWDCQAILRESNHGDDRNSNFAGVDSDFNTLDSSPRRDDLTTPNPTQRSLDRSPTVESDMQDILNTDVPSPEIARRFRNDSASDSRVKWDNLVMHGANDDNVDVDNGFDDLQSYSDTEVADIPLPETNEALRRELDRQIESMHEGGVPCIMGGPIGRILANFVKEKESSAKRALSETGADNDRESLAPEAITLRDTKTPHFKKQKSQSCSSSSGSNIPAFAVPNTSQKLSSVLQPSPRSLKHEASVLASSLQKIQGQAWWNDVVILELLYLFAADDCFIADTNLFQASKEYHGTFRTPQGKEILLFPIHNCRHWSILVLDARHKSCLLYDSLPRSPALDFGSFLSYIGVDWTDQPCRVMNIAEQQNLCDCGPFSVVFGICAMMRCLPPTRADGIQWRQNFYAIWLEHISDAQGASPPPPNSSVAASLSRLSFIADATLRIRPGNIDDMEQSRLKLVESIRVETTLRSVCSEWLQSRRNNRIRLDLVARLRTQEDDLHATKARIAAEHKLNQSTVAVFNKTPLNNDLEEIERKYQQDKRAAYQRDVERKGVAVENAKAVLQDVLQRENESMSGLKIARLRARFSTALQDLRRVTIALQSGFVPIQEQNQGMEGLAQA